MKKIILICSMLFFTNSAFAHDIPKDEAYYKAQIQNQRFLYSETGIINAIKKNRPDVVKLYMNAGFSANTTYMGMPMLMYAINYNQSEITKVLLGAGANANASAMGTTALIYAIYNKRPEIEKILLDAGANPETTLHLKIIKEKSMNALVFSIERESSDCVQALIAHNVDVNKKLNGKSPLNYALEKKQTKIVEMLLKAGATPDEKSYEQLEKSKDEYLKDLFADAKAK